MYNSSGACKQTSKNSLPLRHLSNARNFVVNFSCGYLASNLTCIWAENHHPGFNVFIKCKRGGEPRVLAWMSCQKCGDFFRRPSVSPYCWIVWGQSWERKIDGGESWVDLSG